MPKYSKKVDLQKLGFRFNSKKPALIPYYLWYVDMIIEQDRKLRLVEETVLQLFSAGVTTYKEVATLLGLNDDEVFRRVLIDLFDAGFLSPGTDTAAVTDAGKSAVRDSLTRAQKVFESVPVLYDPYQNRFEWHDDEKLLPSSVANNPEYLVLPNTARLTHDEVKERHREFQGLLQRNSPSFLNGEGMKDLINLESVRYEVKYRRVDVEEWVNDKASDWVITQSDVELEEESQAFLQLEKEGLSILKR